jgi:hypothetical protein
MFLGNSTGLHIPLKIFITFFGFGSVYVDCHVQYSKLSKLYGYQTSASGYLVLLEQQDDELIHHYRPIPDSPIVIVQNQTDDAALREIS